MAGSVRRVSSERDAAVARELLLDYLLLADAWAVRNRSPQRLDDLPASMQREVEELPGTLLLAGSPTADVAGIVFLSIFGNSRCEMKRLYVRPEARGNGLGRQLVEAAVTKARKKAENYLRRILAELPGSSYAERATAKLADWSDRQPLNCQTCH